MTLSVRNRILVSAILLCGMLQMPDVSPFSGWQSYFHASPAHKRAMPLPYGQARGAELSEEGKSVISVIESSAPYTLNPLRVRNMVERRTLELIHDGPYTLSENAELEASLIDSRGEARPLEIAQGGMSAVVRMKRAKFHDGTLLTYEDIRDSFAAYSAAAHKRQASEYWKDLVSSVTPIDSKTQRAVRIAFTRVNPVQRTLLLKILPSHAFANPSSPGSFLTDPVYERLPVGLGAFRVVESPWITGGVNWTLDAFRDYHKGAPLIDRIHIRVHPSVQVQVEAMRGGQGHLVVAVNRSDESLFRAAGARIVPYYSRNWWYLGFNQKREVLSRRGVRRAIASIIDRLELARQLAGSVHFAGSGAQQGNEESNALLITGPFVPDSPFYNRGIKQQQPAPELAAQLLKKEGLKRKPGGTWTYNGQPFTLSMAVREDLPGRTDLVALLKQQFRDAGIPLRVYTLGPNEPDGTWDFNVVERGRLGAMKYDLILGRWSVDQSDAIHTIFQTGGTENYLSYSDSRIDANLKEFLKQQGDDRKIFIMQEVHRLLAEEMPCVFLWTLDEVAALSPKLKGVQFHPYTFYVNPHKWRLEP